MPDFDYRLAEALCDVDEKKVRRLIEEKLAAGVSAGDILAECSRGMTDLGRRFADGDCFIPELIMGGMILRHVMADLAPLLEQSDDKPQAAGVVVLGSVQHDVHDIGKDIVAMMLRGAGFEVVDLGVDAPPEKFVEAIRQHHPQVVGMSVLLTTCYDSVKRTVEAIRGAGLRDQVAIMVGGAAASELLSREAGCDFYGKTAVDGMHYAVQVVGA